MNILQILENFEWREDFILVTSDVSSLYSIIPHEKGNQAINVFLEKDEGLLKEQLDFILEGIELILKNNYFWFNDTFYLQEGPAMGTKFAPSYANLFMAYWEQTWMPIWKEDIATYHRYTDDVTYGHATPDKPVTCAEKGGLSVHYLSALDRG